MRSGRSSSHLAPCNDLKPPFLENAPTSPFGNISTKGRGTGSDFDVNIAFCNTSNGSSPCEVLNGAKWFKYTFRFGEASQLLTLGRVSNFHDRQSKRCSQTDTASSFRGCRKSCHTTIWQRFAVWFLILFAGLRIGEASHPGPFSVGTVNPSGLLGKTSQLRQLPMGLWGVTESHLTDLGLAHFRREMRLQQCNMNYSASASAPYLRSSVGVIGGKATGVGVLSNFPCRSLPENWPDDLRKAGRAHAAAVYVQSTWIRIGVCYGYAKSPHNIITKQKTDEQLALLTQRIVHESTGPRVICGDFNQLTGQLLQEKEWASHGFVEIQQWAAQKWNRPIQYTCKNNSVKDFVWISPELIPYLEDVHLDHHLFADHSVLSATFKVFTTPIEVFVWPKPKPLPWESCDPSVLQNQNEFHPAPAEPTAENLLRCLEDRVNAAQIATSKPCLLPTQRGRCAVRQPKKCTLPLVPLKKSRKGELTPSFVGEHFQHGQWLTQARRFQSLVKLLSVHPLKPSSVEHASLLWQSILKAPGFSKGFRYFWAHSCTPPVGAPATLPQTVPPSSTLNAIAVGFSQVFEQFESLLIAQRQQHAKQRRIDCPTRIFQDVARPPALAVQTLLHKHVVQVTAVSADATIISYEPHSLDLQEPVCSKHALLNLRAHAAGSLHLVEPQEIAPGDVLTQHKLVGDPAEVLRSFEQMWMRFWGRHEQTTAATWAPFVELCQETMDPISPMTSSPITVDMWIKAVKRKKSRSAVGPDGVTKSDLLHMPHDLVEKLVGMINAVEAGAPWPSEWIQGHIHSLAKREDSSDVGDYRPICVFSLIYRVWGTIRSKQILMHLARIAPPELAGSRPHKETAHVWWQVANMIERSFYEDDSPQLTGAIADFTKCFNCLPRVPVLALARLLGLPTGVCVAWHNALNYMQRRFVVNGSVGNALSSSCGFPEGCALSVVSMFMINIVYTRWMHLQNPSLQAWSFVDDWQITATSKEVAIQGLRSMQRFTLMLDLTIDLDKSFLWSTSAEGRRYLRELAHRVKLYDRNLGGHLSYCKVHSNFTVQARLKLLDSFWTWLSRSPAPLHQKLTCLTVVSWPRGLHGIAGVILGKEHYQKLRTKAVQSLGIHRKGTNPKLLLSAFVHPRHDPEFYALLTTFKAFRKFCIPDHAFPLLDWLSTQPIHHLWPGPCGVFITRMHSIGWSWESNGWFRDHEGLVWHILTSPIQTLVSRLHDAWISAVGSEIAQRPEFAGLHNIDRAQTVRDMHRWDQESLGLLRVAMTGAFFTRDWLCKMGKVPTNACPWCGEEDSVFHRNWVCPHFQVSRDAMSSQTFRQLEMVSECTHQHGWLTEAPEARLFRAQLHHLPDMTADFIASPPLHAELHMFTDGSCLHPERAVLRVATWGLVVANLFDDRFEPVGQGPLPGLHQTVVRAELTACVAALKYALTKQVPSWLWSDNQEVVDHVTACMTEGTPTSIMTRDHDLKNQILCLVQDLQRCAVTIRVVKVTSHVPPSTACDQIESWALRGNQAADECAERAREGFSQQFFALRTALCETVLAQDALRRDLHSHFIRVGSIAVADKQKVQALNEQVWEHYSAEHGVTPPMLINLPREWPHSPMPKHGNFEAAVWQWFAELVSPDEGEVHWVCWYQFLLDFQLTTGRIGFYKDQRTRQWFEIASWEAQQEFDFLKAAGGLASFMRSLFNKMSYTVLPENHRPAGICFRKWLRCIRVSISPMRIAAIDNLLVKSGITHIQDVRVAFKDFAPVARPHA